MRFFIHQARWTGRNGGHLSECEYAYTANGWLWLSISVFELGIRLPGAGNP